MEGLTRLVAESLARHGFDRPVDYRRLHWSRWFRCESHHSLLFVPSKPGVFALAEEIMDLDRVGTEAFLRPAPLSQAKGSIPHCDPTATAAPSDEASSPAGTPATDSYPGAAFAAEGRRMLAVTQFFEADDMAFVLDRMLSRPNAMQSRLASGRYFVRFVTIEDSSQRRSIFSALNQWMVSSAEKATGIGSHFASSLELTPDHVGVETLGVPHVSPQLRDMGTSSAKSEYRSPNLPAPDASSERSSAASQLDSGAASNIHCPSSLFPSGF
ncbi:MAG TPA: hypothetical protein VMB66_08230 [Candidatus Acidoferrales bacterium]|nr:hypothetical protein [Candidatus Acidoferrales bacterium]